MQLSVTVLGSNSAVPTANRNPTSQFVTLANRHFLVDCGEGTQVQLRRNKVGFGRINHILISHLHGDHIFGLVPLLTSLHLLDRKKEMHIYGPPDLERFIDLSLDISGAKLKFPITFHPLHFDGKELIFEDKAVQVFSVPLQHSLPVCGFLFLEKERPRHFRKEVLEEHSIPFSEIKHIKRGADWTNENGQVIPNQKLTTPPSPPLSYAFCTDTLPLENLPELLGIQPDLLYHEATFADEHLARAKKTSHSTASQAAAIAKKCGVAHLLIGHFSIRYEELDTLLNEAKSIFSKTHLANENTVFKMTKRESLKTEKQL